MRFKDNMTTETATIRRYGDTTPHGYRTPLPASLPRPRKVERNRNNGTSPPAHVRVVGGAIRDEDRDYIARKLGMKLGKFSSSMERITVRLSDTNGPKGGPDQRCHIKVVLSGLRSVVVSATDSTVPRSIDRAIDAAALAVRRRLERRRLRPLHHRSSYTTV
ncbi:MAG TPA: HPF/RaiA family ribosome-associated protein [Vicinamibacterales bacterium]|jgi:ribosome-associated translation inhibitor RaiA